MALLPLSASLATVIDTVNALLAKASGYIGSATDASGTTTLTTASTDYASTCSVTFELNDPRRVKVTVQARFVPGTVTTARYAIQAAYNTGGSVVVGSATKLGVFEADYDNPAGVGALGSDSQNAMGHVHLDAGTYTAYAIVQRVNGGDTTDTATGFAVLVEDIGAV